MEIHLPAIEYGHRTHTGTSRRAFRVGRGLAYHDKTVAVLEVKKWMLREIASLYARYLYSCVAGTESERLQRAIKFHKMRGHLYQCYKGRSQNTQTQLESGDISA